MASLDSHTPVIVGAAQLTPADGAPAGPIALAVEAVRLAARDSGSGERLLRRADMVGHVATICSPYTNEAALVATELGIEGCDTVRTAQFGGDGPGLLPIDTARAIANGMLDVALPSGAEAMDSLRHAQLDGALPDWPGQEAAAKPARTVGVDRPGSSAAEMSVGLIAPVYNYALLETAVQASLGVDRERHLRSIAEL